MMNRIQNIYYTSSEKETFKLGISLAQDLKPGDSVSLEGDLGTGKTALVKGIARGLGIDDTITSPTFTIVNSYEGIIPLHHFDVYRIDDPDELFDIGWDEYFDGEAVCIVEWGDRVPEMFPPKRIRILIIRDPQGFQKRQITIERQADNN